MAARLIRVLPSCRWLDSAGVNPALVIRERGESMELIGLLALMGALIAPALILPVMFVIALVKD